MVVGDGGIGEGGEKVGYGLEQVVGGTLAEGTLDGEVRLWERKGEFGCGKEDYEGGGEGRGT